MTIISESRSGSAEAVDLAVRRALDGVIDPELGLPITDLGMVSSVALVPAGARYRVQVGIALTIAGCPMKAAIATRVREAVLAVPGVAEVAVDLGVMDAGQRRAVVQRMRPSAASAGPGPARTVIAVGSGKGGVGKSTVAANLAAALACLGAKVGLLDADIYGYSAPRQFGLAAGPTVVDDLFVPPVAHGVKVMSIGSMVKPGQPIVWRGPMLHQVLEQFVREVAWGPLDVLIVDLPPGTGDVALSIAELLPGAALLLVTTPQLAAAEVAERVATMALHAGQPIVGVVENMSWLGEPDGRRLAVFGAGGGAQIAELIGRHSNGRAPLLAQIPLDPAAAAASDRGVPVVLAAPQSAAALSLLDIARTLHEALLPVAGTART